LVPNLKRIKVLSQEAVIERVICFIKVLANFFYIASFIIFLFSFARQANDDIMELARERKPHLLKSPFICCVGTIQHPTSFAVVSEGEVIQAGKNTAEAFKTLYSSFHMFRIPYPTLFSTFFYFFDSFIFRVHPGRIRPCVTDLHALLNAGVSHPSP
jgi:hypothetical protein